MRTALTPASVNPAKGNFDGPRQDYQIDANDQLITSADYKNVVVAYRNNAPVFLHDVANIVDGVENTKQAAWMNQTPAVILNVQRQPGANTISVVKSIQLLLPQLQANLPSGIEITTLTDLDHRHQGLGRRRGIRADADHRPGGDGDLSLPAQPLRHHHSQRGRAAVDRRHLRGHVCARLLASTTFR